MIRIVNNRDTVTILPGVSVTVSIDSLISELELLQESNYEYIRLDFETYSKLYYELLTRKDLDYGKRNGLEKR